MLILKYANTITSGWTRVAGQTVYAVLHQLDGKALDFSAGVATMSPFDGNNNRFGKTLTEQTPRTNYFQAVPMTGTYILTDSPYGQDYQVEYWATLSTSGTKSRTFDKLLAVEQYPWATIGATGYQERPLVLDIKKRTDRIPDSPAGARYEVFTAFSFDSTINRMGFTCWLEKDGQLVADPVSCTLRVTDSSGNIIFDTTVPAAVGPDPEPGFFVGENLSTTLFADDTYSSVCTIIDGTFVSHTSGGGVITWD